MEPLLYIAIVIKNPTHEAVSNIISILVTKFSKHFKQVRWIVVFMFRYKLLDIDPLACLLKLVLYVFDCGTVCCRHDQHQLQVSILISLFKPGFLGVCHLPATSKQQPVSIFWWFSFHTGNLLPGNIPRYNRWHDVVIIRSVFSIYVITQNIRQRCYNSECLQFDGCLLLYHGVL